MTDQPHDPVGKLGVKIFYCLTTRSIESEIPDWLAKLQQAYKITDLDLQFHYAPTGTLQHILATYRYTPHPHN